MDNSILDSVKKACNLDPAYTAFDFEIIMHTNSVLSDLNQIGVGPPGGFQIVDATASWNDFYGGDLTHNNIQSYVCLRVRLLFDPPESSYAITSMAQQIEKAEWRIRERREEYAWVDPETGLPIVQPGPDFDDEVVVTQGTAIPTDDTEGDFYLRVEE